MVLDIWQVANEIKVNFKPYWIVGSIKFVQINPISAKINRLSYYFKNN